MEPLKYPDITFWKNLPMQVPVYLAFSVLINLFWDELNKEVSKFNMR